MIKVFVWLAIYFTVLYVECQVFSIFIPKSLFLQALYDRIRTKLFWLRFDVELYFVRLPTAWWCFKKFLETRDLDYLHDCLWTIIPS